ncbi:MAG: TolC family protein [Bacteroides sp.]|jgi:outer membrane protein TolC|nr:TolC family protein [Bacteroides sp.]
MKHLIGLIFLFFSLQSVMLRAQGPVDAILQEVETNNTTLAAIRDQLEASRVANRTGIFLADPQVDLYLLNNSSENIRRTNFHLMQPLDLSTLLGRRNQLSVAKNQQLDYQYLIYREQILLEAHHLVVDLIYYHALGRELEKRLQHARDIAKAYQAMLDAGEANILDYNKAQINLFNAEKAAELNQIELKTMLDELQVLNGGQAIAFTLEEFPAAVIPEDFQDLVETGFQQNPVLRMAGQEVTISRQEERLARSSYWPGITAGYMMEALPTERFSGFGMGLSIPLWENKNSIKQARLQTLAIEQQQQDLRVRYLGRYRSLYEQAKSLREASLNYHDNLNVFNHSELLMKALEAGQISLIDYLLELGFYYETVNLSLETDRQLHMVLATMEHFVQ